MMMRYFTLGLVGFTALVTAACSGSGDGGTGSSGPDGGGATGGSAGASGGSSGAGASTSSSGAGGFGNGGARTQCQTTADCPQPGCYMCPGYVCDNGRCVPASGGGGAGGATGAGGTTASGGAGGAGPIACGTQTCSPSQACVTPCCGGSPGFQCTPAPPYCVDIPQSCQGQTLAQCLPLSSCFSPRVTGREIFCMCA